VSVLDGPAGAVRIRVQDDGAGIDPAFLPHVFERFRQADGSVSRQHGGLGLGLAIVRHLVELHGGTVHAESAGIGRGSTFTVELPRADADRQPTGPGEHGHTAENRPPRPQTTPLQGCRTLVVDDQDDARELVSTILRGAGAQVLTAASVAEALHHLDTSATDVVLADLGMPGADGFALIREVRRRDAQTGHHLPVAAITAYAGTEDRARALAAGFDLHVAKPIGPTAILDAVVSMWRGRRTT
jgi:CheY-like chemotaxis protein